MTEIFHMMTFDSRSEAYKKPYGAVTSGTPVQFWIRPPHKEEFHRGWLTARFEFDQGRKQQILMKWTGMTEGQDTFTGTLDTENYVGLVWYQFRLERQDGSSVTSRVYQLTVYDGSDRVPDWFGQGVTYQIFPDRFYRTKVPDPTGLVGGRTVHQRWDEFPEWRPDAKGEVRNRDFFGGNLCGVMEKLDYLESMGVETIYFCPIFEAAENHRYGTADYTHIDPMLGTEEEFEQLCREAHKRGMKVLLDGVFNHTGFVSRYFNGDGFYDTVGAHQSQDSPYRTWYNFQEWPDKYNAWWGIYSLPAVNETDPSYQQFVFGDQDSVVRRWLRAGADGWRLDVADELPDDFVEGIHRAVRETNPNAVVIGEVWEDGTTKIAYNVRRKHLLGNHLDGLMNYPFRTATIEYLLGGSGEDFQEEMETLRENYPPFAFYSAMNSLGTHDTLRILTYLGVGDQKKGETREWRANYQMPLWERQRGVDRLKLGAEILFTFPGSPTVYYGDEVGMEGFEDPFNRQTYPWGWEIPELQEHFRKLGQLRKERQSLRRGSFRWETCKGGLLSYVRQWEEEITLLAINNGTEPEAFSADWPGTSAVDLLTGERYAAEGGMLHLTLQPGATALLSFEKESRQRKLP